MADTGRRTVPVIDPRTGATEFDLPVANAAEVRAAADRLRRNQPTWAAMPIEVRCEVLGRWTALIGGKYRQAIIDADARDTGGGQISRIAPDMMIGILRGLMAGAPAMLAAAKREGTARSNPAIAYRSVIKPYPVVGVIARGTRRRCFVLQPCRLCSPGRGAVEAI